MKTEKMLRRNATQKNYKHREYKMSGDERKLVRNLIRRAHGNGSIKELFNLYQSKNIKGRKLIVKKLNEVILKHAVAHKNDGMADVAKRIKFIKKYPLQAAKKGIAIGPETLAQFIVANPKAVKLPPLA